MIQAFLIICGRTREMGNPAWGILQVQPYIGNLAWDTADRRVCVLPMYTGTISVSRSIYPMYRQKVVPSGRKETWCTHTILQQKKVLVLVQMQTGREKWAREVHKYISTKVRVHNP